MRKIMFLLTILLIGYFVTSYFTNPSQYDDFIECLKDKATMYGTDWCSYCQKQKALFGKSFEHINYVNCDTNKKACEQEGITAYPTWIINGEKYLGLKSLESLSSLSGCKLK